MDQLFRMKLTMYIRNMVTKTKAIISEQVEDNPDVYSEKWMFILIRNRWKQRTKLKVRGH